jgi:hypothetical protein
VKRRYAWHMESPRPLEYRAKVGDATLIVRATRGPKLIQWEGIVYRKGWPVVSTTFGDYFSATAWAEAQVEAA